jgi:sporulation protein YlmC with PRC-barrel domain
VNLIHEVLDKQMLDNRRRKMGKVDGIILELTEGRRPRVIALETGVPTLARRLSRRLGRLVEAAVQRLSPERPGSCRIPWRRVRQIDLDVFVELDAAESPVFALERWLHQHVVAHIPGGDRGAK